MAFVLIQHLDPKHESHLTELLSKASKMPVSELLGDTRAEANHVYVIPPRCNLGISNGILHTPPRSERGRNMPIDSFLCALAGDRASKAIGVVLSGTGSDGTLGLQAIKAEGGITFAQEKGSARFDAMPESAIAAGGVDFVLPPAGIARQLVTMASHSSVALEPQEPMDAAEVELRKIFRLLRSTIGVDFTHYKQSTIKRRIRRRMALRGFEKLEDYIKDLEENRGEASALCESFFITVTAFFREPALFQELKKKIFPSLVEDRVSEDPIRIWVPGCATGEEVYSIAMSLTEFLDDAAVTVPFQIFATDVSERAIEKARAGIYTEAALRPISPKQLARFFTKSEHGYQIAKSIRDVCVFAKHDLSHDPPFSKLDLISCCNVLIYLGAVLQGKVLSILHYALKPKGFLVLGPSESTGAFSDVFQQVEKKNKIYRSLPGTDVPAPELGEGHRAKGRAQHSGRLVEARARPAVQTEADRLLLAEYAPAGVIIDDAMNIVQVRGRTGPYLELSPGAPSHNLLRMVREGLIASVSKAIQTARQSNATTKEEGLRIASNGQFVEVRIKVIPFRESSSSERYFLILFEDVAPSAATQPTSTKPAAPKRKTPKDEQGESARLRQELAATKEYLQSIIEEKESALEELTAASEEAQAGNEELETAQEELESANEELNTLNEELKTSNVELSQVNRDLTNLLESINIPLVMVGKDLRIRRFTRAIEPMLNLIASDAGRLITDLQPHIELPDLRGLLADAMQGGNRMPRDIRDEHGCWYSLRILPSAGPNAKIDGAVVMLIDIDAAKRGLDFAEAIVETVREPLVILNHNLTVVSANKAFYETFQANPEETEGHLIYDLGKGQWNIPELRELLDNILPTHSTFRDFEVVREFAHVGRKVMLLNAREVFDANAQARTILLAIEDTTDRKWAEDALKATNAELQNFAYALTHDLQEPVRMVVNFTQLLARENAGKLDEESDKIAGYCVEAALRIEALLKGLLTYWETTEAGQDSFGPVDCNDVLAKTLANLQAAVAQSGATVTSEKLPTLVGEQVMLQQVFQNLIANSIKYRAKEPLRIHISAKKDAEEWLFSVQDNGIGIDPQDAERVFGMFKRLHGPDIPGAGLGLALCKKVVERHGGRIWVESETGQGATFKFTIPSRNFAMSRIRGNHGHGKP